jgi:crotonyl-CoA reductase
MGDVSEALLSGADAATLAAAELPTEMRAAYLSIDDVGSFQGVVEKDVRKSLRVGHVPVPELAPDEVLVAVMASAVNYNTVWSSIFEPIPTFQFLKHLAKQGGWAARHDLPHHVLGSDGAGVVVRIGNGVRHWRVGDRVVISPAVVDEQEPGTHADGMLGQEQRAWGFETNFGGLAEYTVVRASQLIPKPAQLTWEEAAVNPLCAGTAYRMLVSGAGARMKQGDVVLVWGAAGGLGGYAVQFVRNGGGIPIGVVSSERSAEAARRLGCEFVIDRTQIGLGEDLADDPDQVLAAGRRLGKVIRGMVGRDPDIVFEHVGRATFGISLFVVSRGGVVVTCGSSTGFRHEYDNRYLWMKLKRVIGSHGANLREQWDCNRLIESGRVVPTISEVYPLEQVADAVRQVQVNGHIGKVAVLCLAPGEGLGVTDPDLRARIGAQRLAPLRALGSAASSGGR